ncbi:hypothetical protein PENSOL_c001G05386 [Penicillium solitum]|uniref:Reverse transcriptase Ty1/copia-type domain-containing protein n=1 Tax=Penicillium solitum TaxID=60172 RepID=A0A1V6RPR5_9EURO|nr:uncharacterized protein PENSOL_c001G05386 [Penicillium solitum]OQE03646.1 hypothetical protein PENSOL_c001G05386 [Penicillium solitum]
MEMFIRIGMYTSKWYGAPNLHNCYSIESLAIPPTVWIIFGVIYVYVDDFLIAAANSHEINQVQRALEREFRLNDLGTPRSFLGIQFDFQADGSVSIHQYQYIQKLLSDFRMETCQMKGSAMNPKQVLNRRPDEEPPNEETKARFATAVGSLMDLVVGTRPDIAFALGTLSRFTSQPQPHHQVVYVGGH